MGEITNETFDAFQRAVERRTIAKIERDPDTGESWPQGANPVTITLDNGAVIEFDGWGYDAYGLYTTYHSPPLAGSVPPSTPSEEEE